MYYRVANNSDIDALAKIQVDTWKTTYQGIISQDYLQNLTYKEKEIKWKQRFEKQDQNTVIYVAETNNQEIVGYIIATLENFNPFLALLQANKYIGELCAIYILKEYQRKGIGTELVKLVVNILLKRQIKSMIVWILKGNRSYQFYEKLGALYVGQQILNIGGSNYIELAYGWDNLEKTFIK